MTERLNIQRDPASFQCDVCQMPFTRAQDLQLHLWTHGKEFICGRCGKAFAIRNDMYRHQSLHGPDSIYGSGYLSNEESMTGPLSSTTAAMDVSELPIVKQKELHPNTDSIVDRSVGSEIVCTQPLTSSNDVCPQTGPFVPERTSNRPTSPSLSIDSVTSIYFSDLSSEAGELSVQSLPIGQSTKHDGEPAYSFGSTEFNRRSPETSTLSRDSIYQSYSAKNLKLSPPPECTTPPPGAAPDFVGGFVVLFAESLIERIGARVWAEVMASMSSPARIEFRLDALLEVCSTELSREVQKLSKKPGETGVSFRLSALDLLVTIMSDYSNRTRISSYFIRHVKSSSLTSERRATLRRLTHKPLHMIEKATKMPEYYDVSVASSRDKSPEAIGGRKQANTITCSLDVTESLPSRTSAVLYELRPLISSDTVKVAPPLTMESDEVLPGWNNEPWTSARVDVAQGPDSRNKRRRLDIAGLSVPRYPNSTFSESAAHKLARTTSNPGCYTRVNQETESVYSDSTTKAIQDSQDPDQVIDLAYMQRLFESSTAFMTLSTAVKRRLYYDNTAGLTKVESAIMMDLEFAEPIQSQSWSHSEQDSERCDDGKSCYRTLFDVRWDMQNFLRSQFGNSMPQIGTVVTLTGSSLYAQATTCSDYLHTVWPRSASFFLSTLQSLVNHDYEKGKEIKEFSREFFQIVPVWIRNFWPLTVRNTRIEGLFNFSTEGLQLNVALSTKLSEAGDPEPQLLIDAKGTKEMIVELAQELAWIGAAFRTSPYGKKLAYCKPAIERVGRRQKHSFRITFKPKALHSSETPCWLALFSGASIARGFPIPEREQETGLEISLELMAEIAGVRHAYVFDHGIVMKGFSNMFLPIKRSGDRVQWHLISSPHCNTRLSYQEVLVQCPNRALLEEVDLECIKSSRPILGWCTPATSLLGSDRADYESIDYSGACHADSPLKFSGATFGFQQIGLAQFDVTLGPKDGKCHFQRSGPYERIIFAAEKTPIVLYDTAEKRAWLVPASEVMLHMARHRARLAPFKINGERVKLPATKAAWLSATDILLGNASIELSQYENYTFKDMIIGIWSQLEFLVDVNVQKERAPGMEVHGTQRDAIQGYEFKAIVEERSPFQRKQSRINKTSGGWTTLVRDINALVLFAKYYGEVIQPLRHNERIDQGPQRLCSGWSKVPKGKDYLATTVKIIEDLYDIAGYRLDRTYLTSTHLQWHRGRSLLFEPCKTPAALQCQCTRLQRIIPKSIIGSPTPPGLLDPDGAVIFGQSGSSVQEVITTQKPEATSIYSQPNINFLSPVDLHQDPDDAPSSDTSESKCSASSGSGTTESSQDTATSYGSRGPPTAGPNGLGSDLAPISFGEKRTCSPALSLETQSEPAEGTCVPESRKRAKNGQGSVGEGFQCSEESNRSLHDEARRKRNRVAQALKKRWQENKAS